MSEPVLSVRLSSALEPELCARLFRAVAVELAATPKPAAALIEARTGSPDLRLSVRPADLLTNLKAAPALQTIPWDPAPPCESAGSRAGHRVSAWVLSTPDRAREVDADPWDAPVLGSLLGPDGDLSTQTFWLSGRTDGRLWAARRVRLSLPDGRGDLDATAAIGRAAAIDWGRATGTACVPRPMSRRLGPWVGGDLRSLPRTAWIPVPVARVDRLAAPTCARPEPTVHVDRGHTLALGASGAGKTTFLAEAAARALRLGSPVLAFDLHGDLAPALVARLDGASRRRLVAIDASRRPVVGFAALAGGGDREAEQFVAAVKRLSPDGSELYWGFRLERIFESFVRLLQESGGTLADLYALLTDADRRDTARLTTRSAELARFLDELGPVVRRNPEFLWSAAARLAKIVLLPELAELLAPADGGIPVERLLESGRSVVVRLPFSALGPEAAAFAGSLLLSRSYLGLAARRGTGHRGPPTVVVLDEVQAFSPRLVAELLTEGRKFGLRLLLASQYPERLAREVRLAAAGVARTVVAFRVPTATAVEVGGWLGAPASVAQRILPELPVGVGVARTPGTGDLSPLRSAPDARGGDDGAWSGAVDRSVAEFPPVAEPSERADDPAVERLLLAILGAEERGEPPTLEGLCPEALALPGGPADLAALESRSAALERQGLATPVDGRWHLTPAGERRLGLRLTTGATRESSEHRALLLRTFRLFARRGFRLEIVTQGRFDTTLPDARFRQIPQPLRDAPPVALAQALREAASGWAWRFFHGRDVHVEAEVSGALRPARIRHGLEKARRRGAFALFVVGDADRARRVRRTLRSEGVGIDRAQVWTLRDRGERVVASPGVGKPRGRLEPTCASSLPWTPDTTRITPAPRSI